MCVFQVKYRVAIELVPFGSLTGSCERTSLLACVRVYPPQRLLLELLSRTRLSSADTTTAVSDEFGLETTGKGKMHTRDLVVSCELTL